MAKVTDMRISIIGASGSGASTLGRALSKALQIPYFDSDDYFHKPVDPPFSQQFLPQERRDLLENDLGRLSNWILGGGGALWDPTPRLDLTFVCFLTAPTEARIARLRAREYERFGVRIVPGGDMFEQHEEFIEWAGGYDGGTAEGKPLALHEAWLDQQTVPAHRTFSDRHLEFF